MASTDASSGKQSWLIQSFASEGASIDDRLRQYEEYELGVPIPSTPDDNLNENERRRAVLTLIMAGYLYTGRINDAYHLWKRTQPERRSMDDTPPDEDLRSEAFCEIWEGVGSKMRDFDSIQVFEHLQNFSDGRFPLTRGTLDDIRDAYRERVVGNIANVYIKISTEEAARYLGFVEEDAVVRYLQERGWVVTDSGYLSPPKSAGLVCKEEGAVSEQQKIGVLSDIVSFMERKRLNA